MFQLQEAAHSHAVIMMGDFNYPDVCCKSHSESCKQSRRFLECVEDNFLVHVLDKSDETELGKE